MVNSEPKQEKAETPSVPDGLASKVCTCEQRCGSEAGDPIPVVPLSWSQHLVNVMYQDSRGLSLQEKAVQSFLWQVICPGDYVSDRRKLTAKAQLAVQFFSSWKGIV